MSSGSLAGFPVVDVKATLVDGSYHDVDSSVLAFQIAARAAFRCEGSARSRPLARQPAATCLPLDPPPPCLAAMPTERG